MDSDLISRSALLEKAGWFNLYEPNKSVYAVRIKDIREAPPVNAVKVVHGEWIEKSYLLGTTKYCSCCGENYGMTHGTFNYCPNCGAKMKEG